VSERDVAGLLFTAEMYGVQLDQLAVRLALSEVRARALAARWRERGYAESARLGPGRPWIWLTRDGLLACGLPYRPAPPALARLAHLRAVTAVRMALESAPGYLAAGTCRTGRCTGLIRLAQARMAQARMAQRRMVRTWMAAPRPGAPGPHRRGLANAGPSRRS
jgi:hypothetical protein